MFGRWRCGVQLPRMSAVVLEFPQAQIEDPRFARNLRAMISSLRNQDLVAPQFAVFVYKFTRIVGLQPICY